MCIAISHIIAVVILPCYAEYIFWQKGLIPGTDLKMWGVIYWYASVTYIGILSNSCFSSLSGITTIVCTHFDNVCRVTSV
jgi:hypothetical protein